MSKNRRLLIGTRKMDYLKIIAVVALLAHHDHYASCSQPDRDTDTATAAAIADQESDKVRMSETECWSLGLISSSLSCNSCRQLEEFGLQQLQGICQRCCTMTSESGEVRYARAVLEVCTCKFGAYPQIQAFVKSDRPSRHQGLQIRYVRGLDPIIKMMDKDGNVQQTVAIDKWNTDSVDEFLATHLIQPDLPDYLTTNRI